MPLVGKVRWEKGGSGESQVRASPELGRVAAGGVPTTRWQARFEAPLTDVFRVLADIAGRVAQALDVAPRAGQREQLAEKPNAEPRGLRRLPQGPGGVQGERRDHVAPSRRLLRA